MSTIHIDKNQTEQLPDGAVFTAVQERRDDSIELEIEVVESDQFHVDLMMASRPLGEMAAEAIKADDEGRTRKFPE